MIAMVRRGTLGYWALIALALALAPRARADGEGFRIGESGKLHLYAIVAGGYDSNALYTVGGTPLGSGVMDFIPGLKLEAGGRTLQFRLDGSLDYKLYLASAASSANLSHLFGQAKLGFDVNKEGTVGLTIDDAFSSSPSSTSLSLAQSAVSNYNVLDLAVPWRPGGGALTVTASGQWILDSFEPYGPAVACPPGTPCTNTDIGQYSYNQYGAQLQGKWDFLPRTAIVLEGSYFDRAPNNTTVSYPIQGVRVDAGVVGLVTSHLAATVKAGWGGVVNSPHVSGSTWLTNLEVEYINQGVLDARLGWEHNYAADIGTTYSLYDFNRVYLDAKWQAGRFTLKLDGSFEYVKYVLNDVTGPIWQVTPAVDYVVARWCYLGAYYTYTNRSSSQTNVPAFNFTRNQVFATVKVIW